MKFINIIIAVILTLFLFACQSHTSKDYTKKIENSIRAQQIKDMKFGMFICWSFSTISGYEWTRGVTDVTFFKASGCDTDQWCKVAKAANMTYILFLTKHHDGFCLWDTQTTNFKVTNSPLGIDVLATLRKSCDKYGIKLALYFSEGDWTWINEKIPQDGLIPGQPKYGDPIWRTGQNEDLKKKQLKELTTKYGPIEFFWMDHAQSDGGLNHAATAEFVHQFQPNCFVGFNHGEPAGRLSLRERGKPGPIGDTNASKYNKEGEANYEGYLAAEFTYPILPRHKGGADWFYSLPEHDDLCFPAEKIYKDYLGAETCGNIFSINVGPNYEGKIREIDVQTLSKVGKYIRKEMEVTKSSGEN
jgi:alpha-L-fucosidase